MAGIAPAAPPPPSKGTNSPDFIKVATSPMTFINGYLLKIRGNTKVVRHISNGHTKVACHSRSGPSQGDAYKRSKLTDKPLACINARSMI
jgi:hypothetical protein